MTRFPSIELKGKSLTCLILVPRDMDYDFVTDVLDDRRLTETLRRLLEEQGFQPITMDTQIEYGGFVSHAALQILRTIERADAVIVDITGANPNVMYELGFAHGLKKPVLPLLKRGKQKIPSDLQGYLYLPYDTADDPDFVHKVGQWLRNEFNKQLLA